MVEFAKLIEVLEQNGVNYVIIGGLAAIVHGASRITNDLDICYERTEKNLHAIVKSLRGYNPTLRGPTGEGIPFLFDARTLKNGLNFTLKTDLGDLDLLAEVSGLGAYPAIRERAEPIDLFGHPCWVVSLEDLIKAKKAAGRKKDLDILDELNALADLKKGLEGSK